MMNAKKVLVTGADGLLGRAICNNLLEIGIDVVALVRSNPINPLPNVKYIVANFSLDWDQSCLPSSLDAIIHLAQSDKFRDFPNNALDIFMVNVSSTAKLLDYAMRLKLKHFIYASSGGVYGNSSQAFDEFSPLITPGQLGYYLGSKICGETLSQSYASLMRVTVLRPFFIYGPGQNRSMLIPRLFDNIKSGKTVTLHGYDGIHINPVHVRDASGATIAALLKEKAGTFNIVGPEILSIRKICDGIGNYLNINPIYHVENLESKDLIGANEKMSFNLINPKLCLFDNLSDIDA